MAFRTNTSQQLSLIDSACGLTAREQKALDNSWAKIFADDIFPAIDEERFRVLYSTRSQSKFNTPVNICVGALIIKEMFQLSDDDIVESLMLDVRYQDALLVGMEHYYDPNDFNRIFYYSDSSKTDDHLADILEDADKLLEMCGQDFDEVTEYQLLVRCLSEQTVIQDAVRRLKEK